MIAVENLCFDYPGKRALDHISMTIAPHTITALVGPNGAGKTTLLRCLSALETPLQGKITVDGWDTDRYPRKVHEISSYLSDFFGLYDDLTVKQILTHRAWSRHCTSSDIPQLVEETAKRLTIWEYQAVAAGKLSRGLRQRLAIAQTIIHKPKIIFLDEPASGLDPEARHNLSNLLITLQKEGMTLIVSSHILAELEDYCTHMLVMQNGKIVEQCKLVDLKQSADYSTLCIEFTADATPFASMLGTIPNITVKSITQNKVIIDFKGTPEDKNALLKIFIEKNLPVCGISEHKQSMQDVYLKIAENTNKKEKD